MIMSLLDSGALLWLAAALSWSNNQVAWSHTVIAFCAMLATGMAQ